MRRVLGPGEVHIWWIRTDQEPTGAALTTLSEDERRAAARFRDGDARRAFLVRRVARRAVLTEYLSVDPASLVFEVTCVHCGSAHGKPRIEGESLSFNASHAGNVGVLALTRSGELGVDVEALARAEDLMLVAERFFTQRERERLAAHISNGEAARVDFLRAWSAKEAYVKRSGLGLAAPIERLDTTEWLEGRDITDPLDPRAPSFRLHRLDPSAALGADTGSGLVATLVVDASDAPLTVRAFEWRP